MDEIRQRRSQINKPDEEQNKPDQEQNKPDQEQNKSYQVQDMTGPERKSRIPHRAQNGLKAVIHGYHNV